MDIFKIAGLVVITVVATVILKNIKSELSVFPTLLLSVYIISMAVSEFASLYQSLLSLIPSNIPKDCFTYLLKVTGICIMTDFVSDFAIDNGSTSLSSAVCLFGRLSMMVCILPLVNEIIGFM